jgi:glycosyltransferase involved in cell wall biosynthesis
VEGASKHERTGAPAGIGVVATRQGSQLAGRDSRKILSDEGFLKILFLARQLNIGGAERQLVILANELASRGHDIMIASYYPGGALSAKVDTSRVRLVSLGKRSRWDLFSLYVKVVRLMKQEQPDVFHGWMHTQNVVATFVRVFFPKAKLFWCVRSSNLEMVQDWVERFEVWLQSRLSGFADCVVVNSMAGLEHSVSGGIPREKMLFIPNGIDTGVFFPNDAERKRVRTDWGIDDSVKVIGKIARFDPIKNHPLFLQAAARIAVDRPDVRFVCVGHGKASYVETLRELTRTLGIEDRVRWIEARPDVRAVYNAIDVFCSASLSEGFPNVIGEAMACARHCVVTDVGDSKLVVGPTGIAVPPNDVDALTNALREKLDADEVMNLKARQRILENFTVPHLGDLTEQALLRSVRATKRSQLAMSQQVHPSVDAQ